MMCGRMSTPFVGFRMRDILYLCAVEARLCRLGRELRGLDSLGIKSVILDLG